MTNLTKALAPIKARADAATPDMRVELQKAVGHAHACIVRLTGAEAEALLNCHADRNTLIAVIEKLDAALGKIEGYWHKDRTRSLEAQGYGLEDIAEICAQDRLATIARKAREEAAKMVDVGYTSGVTTGLEPRGT